MRKNSFFINKLIAVVALAVFVNLLYSCQKPAGKYYDYKNPNTVYNGSTYQFLQSQQGLYDSLLYVVDRLPQVKSLLEQGTHTTLFAAANKNFEIALENLNLFRKLQSKPPLYLQDASNEQLDTLMSRYVFPVEITTDSISMLSEGKIYPSLLTHNMHLKYQREDAGGFLKGGPQLIIFSDMKASQFERYWVKTTTSSVNVKTKTGAVHILVGNHEFGFGEFTTRLNK